MLRSDVVFQLYLTALLKTGLESSINSAVSRRESLLTTSGAPPGIIASSEPASSITESSSSLPHGDSKAALSRSQQIAQAVLSGQSPVSSGHSAVIHSTDMSKLAVALGSGAGISGNPLHVAITERQYSVHFL